MKPTEPRFILIDKFTKQVFQFTTDQVQSAFWRMDEPKDGAYFETGNQADRFHKNNETTEL